MKFVDYQTNLADFLATGSTRFPLTQRKLLINLARKYLLRRYDLSFGETTTSFATVALTQGYNVPSLFSRPLELYYINSLGAKVHIEPLFGKEVFTVAYPNATASTGAPVNFTVWAGQFLLGPTPDAVYTVYVDYYALPTDLVADNDEATLDVNAWEAILYGALTLAESYMIEDERNPVWGQQAKMFEDAIASEYRRSLRQATRVQSSEPG